MSHGLPDYYRGVDIAYQALSEMINRPKYGAAQKVSGNVVVGAYQETTLFSASGKGVTYSGIVFCDHTSTREGLGTNLYVDDELCAGQSFAYLNQWGAKKERSYPFYLLAYDNTNFIYCVALARGITFEESFKIAIYNGYITSCVVGYNVQYALI